MTILEKLKIDILEELISFEEKENIQFDEDTNFLREVVSARSMNELEDIRGNLNYNACLALFQSCKDIVDYYSKLFTNMEIITKYNDDLSDYSEELELVDKKTSIKDYTQYKKIFAKLLAFNRKLRQNKNNLVGQTKHKIKTKIYPGWASILTLFYVSFIGIAISNDIFDFSYYMIGGWIASLFLLWGIIILFSYPIRSPFEVKA